MKPRGSVARQRRNSNFFAVRVAVSSSPTSTPIDTSHPKGSCPAIRSLVYLCRRSSRHVVAAPDGKFATTVRDLTAGAGVDCVYDSVGVATWADSLASVRRRGTVASFGGASGDVRDLDLFATGPLGSPRLVRAVMASHTVTDAETKRRARDLFRAIAAGHVTPRVGRTYALKDAAQAHRDIEARRTTGACVLLP